MAPDRDLNVAFGHALGHLGRGWEMMAATGVRGLRLAEESGALDALVLTDRRSEAITVLARNASQFNSPALGVVQHDAHAPLGRGVFDYVDLDPYGSPEPYLDAAFASLRAPGVLAVTATDMRVLAGAERGAAERRYGGVPIRGRLGPEAGLRLLLAHVAVRARGVNLTCQPLLAYMRDHHVRAYLRLDRGPAPTESEELPVATLDPADWPGPRLPAGGPYGPLWVGPLFDAHVVGSLRVPTTASRPEELGRTLERFQGELVADQPFFYESNVLAKEEHLDRPPAPDRLIDALRAHGWRAARTHARDGAFRTDAPRTEVVRVARPSGP
ncbi:MAG: hypothetical protein L3K17_02440 [Thermoplasmata archaeon]|nr:hypothetical protein [Thermoplasmata archaeon]